MDYPSLMEGSSMPCAPAMMIRSCGSKRESSPQTTILRADPKASAYLTVERWNRVCHGKQGQVREVQGPRVRLIDVAYSQLTRVNALKRQSSQAAIPTESRVAGSMAELSSVARP